jgi:hypothetical protein
MFIGRKNSSTWGIYVRPQRSPYSIFETTSEMVPIAKVTPLSSQIPDPEPLVMEAAFEPPAAAAVVSFWVMLKERNRLHHQTKLIEVSVNGAGAAGARRMLSSAEPKRIISRTWGVPGVRFV